MFFLSILISQTFLSFYFHLSQHFSQFSSILPDSFSFLFSNLKVCLPSILFVYFFNPSLFACPISNQIISNSLNIIIPNKKPLILRPRFCQFVCFNSEFKFWNFSLFEKKPKKNRPHTSKITFDNVAHEIGPPTFCFLCAEFDNQNIKLCFTIMPLLWTKILFNHN